MTTLRSEGGYAAEVAPFGPSQAEVGSLQRNLERNALRRHFDDGARYAWLEFKTSHRSKGSDGVVTGPRFRGTLYDYTNHRTFDVSGPLDSPDDAVINISARQPTGRLSELDTAEEIVRRDPTLGPAIARGLLRVYQPMPPFVTEALPDGRVRRLVTVGLFAKPGPTRTAARQLLGGSLHRFLAVDLATGETSEAGPMASVADNECGAPMEDDDCPPTGSTGQASITVTAPDGSEIWRLVVVRPAESSGTNGSGIELREVYYRNRSVLFQAHVPILNVQYQASGPCVAFRDWLDEEACFEADGTDVVPGIRVTQTRPRTVIENGIDGGNFKGVAIFFEGNDLLLVSETRAGWYRYISEWRLTSDGTVRPRFGFSAVESVCTCLAHVHHAYWRLDFDVDSVENRIEEFNDPTLADALGNWTPLLFEIRRERDPSRNRQWRISSATTGAHFTIVPGSNDGTVDQYGGSDAWFLVWKANEIDDGQGFTSADLQSRQRIDLFMNGELLEGNDNVVWYAGHWLHDHDEIEGPGEFLGPEIVCSWSEDIPEPTTTTTTSSTTTTTHPGGGGGGGGGGGSGGGGGGGGRP